MPDVSTPRRHRGALILGALGLLLCWIPWAGLAVSAVALGVAVWARRRGAKVGWAAALGVWGLVLGLLFTGVVVVYPPAQVTESDREKWDDFDRAFDDGAWPDDEGPGAGGAGENGGPGAGAEAGGGAAGE